MCGIISVTGDIKDFSGLIDPMLESLAKRGPDDRGVIEFNDCILGHTRLSIIDLSSGHQPMKDNQGDLAITFNGEIYNYNDLKIQLEKKGCVFNTNSDTEVILKIYKEYGNECAKHLDGMFAFAIWNNKTKELFIARDRFGKKPLYYAFYKNKDSEATTLVVASEIKALLASGKIDNTLSLESLDNYLQLMYIPPWKSIYKDIHQLPPAHIGVFKNGTLETKRYWKLNYKPLIVSYADAKKEVKRLIDAAVKKRMLTSDVEIGAFLSGGVDSTYISILAKKYLDHPIKTFSLGYGNYINELPYAALAAQTIGSDHHTIQAKSSSISELEKVISYFDEPHADTSDFPQQVLAELTQSFVKVALSGDGADEIFMGYGWHTRHNYLSYRAHTFEKVFLNPFQGRMRAQQIFLKWQRLLLWGISRGFKYINNNVFIKDAYDYSSNHIQNITTFDLTTYLPGQLLTKIDRTSMMHSLEIRSPFLDTELVEYVSNLPIEYKINRSGQKAILKDLLSEYLPKEFVYRRKQGFGAPTTKWLRDNEMKSYLEHNLGPDAQIRKIFSGKIINKLISGFYQKRNDGYATKLWTLLCLEIWIKSAKPKIN